MRKRGLYTASDPGSQCPECETGSSTRRTLVNAQVIVEDPVIIPARNQSLPSTHANSSARKRHGWGLNKDVVSPKDEEDEEEGGKQGRSCETVTQNVAAAARDCDVWNLIRWVPWHEFPVLRPSALLHRCCGGGHLRYLIVYLCPQPCLIR